MYLGFNTSNEEEIEKLEQLRWLQNHVIINVNEVEFNGMEINTPEDLEKWKKIGRAHV